MPRTVRAARLTWTLPEKVTVTRVQPEGGALVFWRQDGPRLTVHLGFKAVPRSGARVALISVKPGAPVTLSSPDLGYEARGGDGKVLAQKLTAAEQKAAQDKATQEKAPEPKPKHPLNSNGAPTGLYNGMIHPLAPFALRGMGSVRNQTVAGILCLARLDDRN